MVPAVAGPIQLDTASITVTLETPYRHDGDETRLCLALGRERYELASPGFPDRSSDDHGAQVRRIDTAGAPWISVTGELITATGSHLPLREAGYSHGVDQWACLYTPAGFAKGVVISALRLRSSGPLTVDRVVWYVHF